MPTGPFSFHAQMNLYGSTLEPASSAFGQLRRFRQLDHLKDINIEAPGYFYKFWDFIEQTTYDEMDGNNISFRLPESYNTANLIITEPKFKLFDIANTDTIETAKEVVNIAFKKTAEFFSDKNKNAKGK